jgi:hypothetical protein
MIYKFAALLFIFIFSSNFILAQLYEDLGPCDCKYNVNLKKSISNGLIHKLEYLINNYRVKAWSTSILKPSGKPPAPIENDELNDSSVNYDNWTCMYSAFKAMDGDPNTTWAEGVEGEGIGEILVVKVNLWEPVQIWSGYGISDKLFRANNRPKIIKIYLLQSTGEPERYQSGNTYTNIVLITNINIKLKDINNYQDIKLPEIKYKYYLYEDGDKSYYQTFLAIEILSVYKGNKYNDTCICEVRNNNQ